jgi:endonuclease G
MLVVGTFVLIAILLITLVVRGSKPAPRLPPGDPPTSLVRYGLPKGHDRECKLLVKSHYECFHDARLKISRWAAYVAEGEDTTHAERYQGGFYDEPDLPFGQRAELNDYKGIWKWNKTGYDKGHQAPDATIKEYGPDAQRETYSLANITPQHSEINEGVWLDLESAIRHWSSPSRPVWVITGPVFFANQETLHVGPDHVAVPDAYFDVVERDSAPSIMTFLVVNTIEGPWYTSLDQFLVSVDSVQKLTGLNLLPDLPETLQTRLEKAVPRHVWKN